MKTLLLTLISVLTLNSYAQNVNIPDANFKAYLVGNASINTNLDAEIQVSEATAFGGTIDCGGQSISDLTGIEAFTALNHLDFDNNQLTSLDVTQNTALTELYCADNQLTSLDVTQNTGLIWLGCSNNQITSLDLSQNTALTWFWCTDNQLTCLNLKNGNNTDLTVFSVTGNPNLTCIEVDDVAWSDANMAIKEDQMYYSTSCNNACTVGLNELSNTPKQLLKIVDLMGRETEYKPNTVLIYVFDDGSTEKVFKMED